MLTNFEIEDHCRRLGIPLVAITNKDRLPPRPQQGCFVLNLQDDFDEHGRDLAGTHWTAFIIEGKQACYYDSFGFNAPAQVQHFLKRFEPYPYATKQVQNPRSTVCGYYVIYFMWFMSRHKKVPFYQRFDKFMSLWSEDYTKNQQRLEKYLKPISKNAKEQDLQGSH